MKYRSVFLLLVIFLLGTGCLDEKEGIEFACCDPSEKQVICLNADKEQVEGNGKEVIELTACIAIKSDKKFNQIKFISPEDAGSFDIDGTSNEIVRTLNNSRTTSTILNVGTTPGTYRLLAEITADSITYTDEVIIEVTPSPSEALSIVFDPPSSSWIADSNQVILALITANNFDPSVTELDVSIGGPISFLSFPKERTRKLTFDNSGDAQIRLQSGDISGQAFVDFEYQGFSQSTMANINGAPPTEITLVSSTSSAQIGVDTISINAFIRRAGPGKTSRDIEVELDAFQLIDGSVIKAGTLNPPFAKTTGARESDTNFSFIYQLPLDTVFSIDNPLLISSSIMNDGNIISDTLTISLR